MNRSKADLPVWAKLLNEYYGVFMDDARCKFWLSEMQQSTQSGGTGSHTTEDEIVDAIRFVRAKTTDREIKGKDVTLDTLIIWVRWYRKSKRNDNDGLGEVVQSKCGVCDNGWVLCWPNLPANPAYADF